MKKRIKVNWGLLGLFIGGVGMLCDHMKDQEEETERNKSIEELKGRVMALENKYKEVQNDK